jgi:hypothetical protein
MTGERVARAFPCSYAVSLLQRSEIDAQPNPLHCSRFRMSVMSPS